MIVYIEELKTSDTHYGHNNDIAHALLQRWRNQHETTASRHFFYEPLYQNRANRFFGESANGKHADSNYYIPDKTVSNRVSPSVYLHQNKFWMGTPVE